MKVFSWQPVCLRSVRRNRKQRRICNAKRKWWNRYSILIGGSQRQSDNWKLEPAGFYFFKMLEHKVTASPWQRSLHLNGVRSMVSSICTRSITKCRPRHHHEPLTKTSFQILGKVKAPQYKNPKFCVLITNINTQFIMGIKFLKQQTSAYDFLAYPSHGPLPWPSTLTSLPREQS